MQPSETTFCVLTDSRSDSEILARRCVLNDGRTTVRSGNQKWTADPNDIWHMRREDAEEIASNLRYNNPRICQSFKAIKRMQERNMKKERTDGTHA